MSPLLLLGLLALSLVGNGYAAVWYYRRRKRAFGLTTLSGTELCLPLHLGGTRRRKGATCVTFTASCGRSRVLHDH